MLEFHPRYPYSISFPKLILISYQTSIKFTQCVHLQQLGILMQLFEENQVVSIKTVILVDMVKGSLQFLLLKLLSTCWPGVS